MKPARSVVVDTLAVSAMVCVVCAVLVSTAAVTLRERQTANAELARRRNVLTAAGVLREGETLPRAEVERRFATFEAVVVDLRTDKADPAFDPIGYDARRAQSDPAASQAVPRNDALI